MRLPFCFSRSCRRWSEVRAPEVRPCWPGLESNFDLSAIERRALLRNRSVPSRRESLALGPRQRATSASFIHLPQGIAGAARGAGCVRGRRWAWGICEIRSCAQIRRRFCGRQPLCGTGVTSEIDVMRMPSGPSARTEDSRPGPGPLISTSRFLMPWSRAARPATSDATWAANGVDLREPLKPWPPDDAQDKALPCRSVIVMMVLLNEACTCAIPSATFLRIFLRTRWAALLTGDLAMMIFQSLYFFSAAAPLRGPLRVRALVRVRLPRTRRVGK